jgi:hypothetical protein
MSEQQIPSKSASKMNFLLFVLIISVFGIGIYIYQGVEARMELLQDAIHKLAEQKTVIYKQPEISKETSESNRQQSVTSEVNVSKYEQLIEAIILARRLEDSLGDIEETKEITAKFYSLVGENSFVKNELATIDLYTKSGITLGQLQENFTQMTASGPYELNVRPDEVDHEGLFSKMLKSIIIVKHIKKPEDNSIQWENTQKKLAIISALVAAGNMKQAASLIDSLPKDEQATFYQFKQDIKPYIHALDAAHKIYEHISSSAFRLKFIGETKLSIAN